VHARDLHGLLDRELRRDSTVQLGLLGPRDPQRTAKRVAKRTAALPMRHTFANQMLMCHPPHLARPTPATPPTRASIAAAIRPRLMHGQQQPPAISQPTDLRARQRQQSRRITLLRHLVKQVKAAKNSRAQRVIQRMAHGSLARPAAWSSA
jgi:hypothetical protein